MNILYPKYFLVSLSLSGFVILSGVEESFGQNISINTTGAANTSLSMLEILQLSTTANSKGLYILHSGTPIAGTGYGMWSEITGASTNNIGGYFSASGASTINYGVQFVTSAITANASGVKGDATGASGSTN